VLAVKLKMGLKDTQSFEFREFLYGVYTKVQNMHDNEESIFSSMQSPYKHM